MILSRTSITHSFQLLLMSLLIATNAVAQQKPPATAEPLEGYADVHVHQMANLGFSGSIVWGNSWGPPEVALRPIPANMRRGHNATEVVTHGGTIKGLVKLLINAYLFDAFATEKKAIQVSLHGPALNSGLINRSTRIGFFVRTRVDYD